MIDAASISGMRFSPVYGRASIAVIWREMFGKLLSKLSAISPVMAVEAEAFVLNILLEFSPNSR